MLNPIAMKKPFVFGLIMLALFIQSGCAEKQPPVVTIVEEGYEPFLLGDIYPGALQVEPYADWYQKRYDTYEPKAEVMADLQAKARELDYLIFLGTWCEDSQYDVPRIMKILDGLGVPDKRIRMIAVDEREGERYKTSPGGLEKEYGVDLVPTLIVFRGERELGRIVEMPDKRLEEDMLAIFNKD